MVNDLSSKRILLTGGNGFLGSFVLEELTARGIQRESIRIPRSRDLDLRLWENCLKAVEGVDIVIHLAAMVGGIGFNLKYPGELFYDNAIMGIQLMEAGRRSGVDKFVCVGTICAYPKFTPVPFKEEDLWNGYPEETNAPYGVAKKALLVQAQSYRKQYGFNAIYLLPVNLYGPGDNFDPEDAHVIPALILKFFDAKNKGLKKVTAWGTGSPSREFLYVKDAAKGIVSATEKYEKGEPVNLGSGEEIRIRNLVNMIKEIVGYEGDVEWDTSRPDGQPERRLDVSRAKKEFGFQAQTPLKEGLAKTIEWYNENVL
ncbi:MAG TPA: GDP-L-fucose synthase [Syntrophales bacterium]|nr:GDP-L-fucose synthase [Syntrophales bacterium]